MVTGHDDIPVPQSGGAVIPAQLLYRVRSLNSVQTRECGHTSRSPLDSLESAIGFTYMRDWWQPTKANFFGHLKKPRIIAALNDAGLSVPHGTQKMKKGDAAEHAEFTI